MDLEKLVEEIRLQVPFKEETEIGDIVAIISEIDIRKSTLSYARVMSFQRNLAKRDEWWLVGLVFLDLPLNYRTYILQSPQFTGREIFTINGKKTFIKAINLASFLEADPGRKDQKDQADSQAAKDEQKSKSAKPLFTLVR
jgi:hypothetical protein